MRRAGLLAWALACGGTSPAAPVVVATATGGIRSLAADDQRAYWSEIVNSGNSGAIMSAPLDGGTPVTLADALGASYAIAVDTTHVYWTAFNFQGGNATVASVPIGGGTTTQLATNQSLGGIQVACDPSSVYYPVSGPTSVDVVSVPLAGGNVTTVAHQANAAMATDGTFVYFSDQTGNLSRVPVAGGMPTLLHQDPRFAAALRTDGVNLYWVSHDDPVTGSIVQMPVSGGAALVLAGPYPSPGGPAIDKQFVYWRANDSILRVPIGGGPVTIVTQVVSSDVPFNFITVTDSAVVWVDSGGPSGANRVMMLPK